MSVIRVHLDEDCQSGSLATVLLQHGVDVTTTKEAGLAGASDEEQLHHAFAEGRVVISNNIADFSAIHSDRQQAGRDHAGIVLFPQQQFSVGVVVRRLLRLRQALTAEDMQNRLEWLSSWGAN